MHGMFYWWLLLGAATAEIEHYMDCGRRTDFCQNRSIEFLSAPQNLNIDNFFQVPCYCDAECLKYDDCCSDRSEWPRQNLFINNIAKSLWTCKPITPNIGIYLVDDCKESSDVSSLCARQTLGQDYHYSLDLPVYSAKTGNYYANVFCAICHKDTTNLQALKTALKCTGPSITLQKLREEGKYLPGLRKWKAGNETCTLVTNDLVFEEGQARRCVPSISDCPTSWEDVIVRDKCRSYQLLVKDNGSVFKNAHCALCNGVPFSKLHCWRNFSYKAELEPSLFMIFDFNWDPNSCPLPKSVWDSLHGVCREIHCKDPICQVTDDCDEHKKNDSNCAVMKYTDMLTLKIEGYLTEACLAISITCLIFHNIIFYTLPNQTNLPSRILNSLSWALIVAQTSFLVGISPIVDVPNEVCKVIAVFIHFFFLSAFFWMNVMSIDIWHTFSKFALNKSNERTHTKYALYAWGSSALVILLAILADFTEVLPKEYRPYYAASPGVCWFANRIGLGIFLYAPISCLLCTNVLLFSITVCWFQRQANNAELPEASGRKEYTRLWLYVKLSTIMGLSWAFGMIAALAHIPIFWYPFILFNGLQGAFIFLMFDLKSNIMALFFERIGLKQYLKTNDKRNKMDTQSSKLSTSQTSRNSLTKL